MDEMGNLTSNSEKMADVLNAHFVRKVTDLRETVTGGHHGDPFENLRRWLDTKGEITTSELNPLKMKELWQIMGKVKPGKSSGADTIDGYTLKLAFPIISETILHLVNL